MIQENEIVMFLLGVGVFVFTLLFRSRLRGVPAAGILLAAYYVLLSAWLLTIVEGFFPEESLRHGAVNFAEHLGYAGCSLLFAAWCWRVFVRREGRQ